MQRADTAIAAAPADGAAGGPRPMRRLAHLSDLHFGATDPAVVEALAADLAADPPDLVLISGDLTMRARRREFREARRFIESLPAPALAVPGNHDVSPFRLAERFLDPFATWRRELGCATEWVWQDEELAILGLNTARRGGWYLDWSRGRVSRAALERLSVRLAGLGITCSASSSRTTPSCRRPRGRGRTTATWSAGPSARSPPSRATGCGWCSRGTSTSAMCAAGRRRCCRRAARPAQAGRA